MSEVSRGCVVGVLASCVVHATIAIVMPRHGQASERTAQEPLWFELQVESSAARAPRELPEAAPSGDRGAREAQHSASQRRERSARPRPAQVAEEPAPPVELATDAIDADALADQATPDRKRAVALDLSPRAAARALVDPTFVRVHDSGVSREERPLSHQAQTDQFAKQVPGLRASRGAERTGEGVVVDAVEDTLYNVLRPWKLLSKTMRGSEYRYTGEGFDAAILPDGRVRFRDKDGPVLTVMATQPGREGEVVVDRSPGVAGGVNLGDPRSVWYRIRGKDPHAAERRRFLERTRALREYLAGRPAERGTPPERSVDTEPKEPPLEPPTAR